MPYLGQSPSKGDENNFKILDDISSYTLTFDGSDSSVVSAANDTITSLTHRFVQGQRVTYNKGSGGTVIPGLSDGVYYIIKHDHHNIKLATSASNASNGTAVNITNVGGGSSHTLNVAFDGVNTKFKATHTNGQKAKITRSAQLVISINGVIQQPHDSATPSTGFGFDLDGTIVFSQAPVVGDIYWAHVLTNNNVTFDISDNDIDNFTGNGSTTVFNLAKTPPDNRNVLVTIDGVVQYPNDPDGTVRAYNVVENVLTFNSAPAADVQIQVRHIGFAGSSSASGGVTNFYGRTGSVVLTNSDNITVNDAAITGDATVTGNLTVNGTTTTLDTNLIDVDKIEVTTAGTNVAVAVTHNGTGDLIRLYDGSSQVVTVDDEGKIGIGVASPNAIIEASANNASAGYYLKNTNNTSGFGLRVEGGGTTADRYSLAVFNAAGEEAFRVNANKTVGIGSAIPTEKLDVHGNVIVTGTITGSSFVGGLPITNGADNRVITAASASSIQGESLLTFNGFGLGINDTSGNARLIVSGNSDNGDQHCQIRIYDTDTTSGSQIPSVSFWGGSTEIGRIRSTDTAGMRFYTANSGTLGERLNINSTGHTTLNCGVHDGGLSILAANNNQETRLRLQGKASDGTGHSFYLNAKRSANRLDITRSDLSPAISVMSTLNVGIQNSGPVSPLQVGGGTSPHTNKATVHIAPSSGNASLCLRGGNPTIFFDKTGSPANAKILLDNVPLAIYSGTIDSEGTEKLRITSTGNVSIHSGAYGGGGTVPQLYVVGTGGRQVKIHNTNAGTSSIQLSNATTGQGEDNGFQLAQLGGGDFYFDHQLQAKDVVFRTKPSGGSITERLRITSAGNIEVKGTRAGSLQANDDDALKLYTKSTSADINRGVGITFYTHDGSGYEMGGTIQVAKETAGANNPASYMRFSTQSGSTTIERLRITSDGIIETGTAIGASGADGDQRLRVGRDGNCNIAVRATASTTAYTGIDFGDSGDDRAGRIQYMHNGDFMSFHTNGAGNGADNERLRITSDGRILVNSTNVYGSIGGNFHVVNTNMGLNSFANNPHAQTFHFTKSRATSGQGGTIVQDNDFCGHIEWYADDGVDTASQIAKISARIDGTPGANDTPGELLFYTTPDGANASTERVRITASGDFQEKSDGTNWYNVVTGYDIGTNPNEIPINQMLGGMAYMDPTNYEQVYEIPSTNADHFNVQSSGSPGGQLAFGTVGGGCPDPSIAWPDDTSGSPIDLWVIDFALHCTGVSNAGRNDLYLKMRYNTGSTTYGDSATEWNNWILARTGYNNTSAGWNQINNASASTWGRAAVFMDANQYVTGHFIVFRGGAGGVTRPGLMWDFNYTHGGAGATRAFGSAHATMGNDGNATRRVASLSYDLDAASWISGSQADSQNIAGFVRQRGFRLQ